MTEDATFAGTTHDDLPYYLGPLILFLLVFPAPLLGWFSGLYGPLDHRLGLNLRFRLALRLGFHSGGLRLLGLADFLLRYRWLWLSRRHGWLLNLTWLNRGKYLLNLAASRRWDCFLADRCWCRVLGDGLRFLFAAQFANWRRLNLSSAGAFDDASIRAFVDHGLVDGGIIHDHHLEADRFQKPAFLYKDVSSRRTTSNVNLHDAPPRWTQWAPTDVSAAFSPRDPRGRPLRLRHPIPAKLRVRIPAAIMVGGPAPRLIADPVPTSIGLLPVTVAIRAPASFHSARDPAASVGSHNLPPPVRAQRLIEIAFGVNRHPHRYLGCVSPVPCQRPEKRNAENKPYFPCQAFDSIHGVTLRFNKSKTRCCSRNTTMWASIASRIIPPALRFPQMPQTVSMSLPNVNARFW